MQIEITQTEEAKPLIPPCVFICFGSGVDQVFVKRQALTSQTLNTFQIMSRARQLFEQAFIKFCSRNPHQNAALDFS